MSSDAMQLRQIRADLAAIAPAQWARVSDDEGEFVEAAGPMGELLPVARFHPGATDEEKRFLVNAPDAVRFLLHLVDRAIQAARRTSDAAQSKAKDFAAECAMKCAEPAFKAYLEAEHGLERPLTDERCAQRVRSLCGVASRKEFNQPGRAADAWQALRKSFDEWKRRARR